MIVSRCKVPYINAQLDVVGKTIDRVTKYRYLGSWLYEDWDKDKEIKSRIEMTRNY